MKRALTLVAISLSALAAGSSANAASIVGFGDPASDPELVGGTQINFSGTLVGTYPSLSIPGVTITGSGGPLRIDDTFSNQYNTVGNSIDNNAGQTGGLLFAFDDPVSAFAFNFGASDATWTLTAFSGANPIGTLNISPTRASNSGEYFGLTGSAITSATLTSGPGDWIFVDNFTFVAGPDVGAVPEPSTWAMMLLGFGFVGGAMRSAKRRQKLTVSYA